MEINLIIMCLCLFLALLGVMLRFLHLKREIRRFSAEVDKLKEDIYTQPLKLTCFDKDITNLAVKINEHVGMQQELSRKYQQEKDRLNNVISGISHDFRTPLTAALGYMQMIEKSGELSKKNEEYLAIAVSKNEYLKELSDEFFELSKLENDKEEFTTESVNLSNLLSDSIMEQYSWIEECGVIPEFNIADGIIIKSNRRYVMRIVQNLLSNGEKYAVHYFGVTLLENEGKVELTVFNDMEDENEIDVSKVFEPFYKAYARNRKGTGLGLYVVKCLSERLGFVAEAYVDEEGRFAVKIVI